MGGVYTRLVCVCPVSGLKLTRFGYSLKSHEGKYTKGSRKKEVTRGAIYRMYNHSRQGMARSLDRQKEDKSKHKNMDIFTFATQLSETTRRPCNSMYNICTHYHIGRYEGCKPTL